MGVVGVVGMVGAVGMVGMVGRSLVFEFWEPEVAFHIDMTIWFEMYPFYLKHMSLRCPSRSSPSFYIDHTMAW